MTDIFQVDRLETIFVLFHFFSIEILGPVCRTSKQAGSVTIVLKNNDAIITLT